MALILGGSIADNAGLDEADVVRRYMAWYLTGSFDTGPVWNAVFNEISAGADPKQAARIVDQKLGGMTAGVNAAHRATAIGCASAIPDELVPAAARLEARLTHWHSDAAEASVATAMIVRRMLRGASWCHAVAAAAACTTGLVNSILLQKSIDARRLSPGGYAPKTLEAALYFTQSSTSFAAALRDSIAFAGPCNYCPVLVGAFSALRFGVQPVTGCPVEGHLVQDATKTFDRLWKQSIAARTTDTSPAS
jgi:ADP-ribosyl-[dinitrogen reductase] hydrolase